MAVFVAIRSIYMTLLESVICEDDVLGAVQQLVIKNLPQAKGFGMDILDDDPDIHTNADYITLDLALNMAKEDRSRGMSVTVRVPFTEFEKALKRIDDVLGACYLTLDPDDKKMTPTALKNILMIEDESDLISYFDLFYAEGGVMIDDDGEFWSFVPKPAPRLRSVK